jgi:hypothetical protein
MCCSHTVLFKDKHEFYLHKLYNNRMFFDTDLFLPLKKIKYSYSTYTL